MNEHAKFLREESDAAMADDCPVASNGLKRAADEIERLTADNERLTDENAEYAKCHDKVMASNGRLNADNERLRAVYDAAHKAAMYCVRDGDGEAHIAVRFMQPLDDALNALAAVEDKE